MTRYRTEATVSLEFASGKSDAKRRHETIVYELAELVRGCENVEIDATTVAVKDSKPDIGTTHYEGPGVGEG